MMTAVDVTSIPAFGHDEAMVFAAEEFRRLGDLLGSLRPDEWQLPTTCSLWDVRAMAGHMLGMAELPCSLLRMRKQMKAAERSAAATGEVFIDCLTAMQVADHAGLSTGQLLDALRDAAVRNVKARTRIPGIVRTRGKFASDPLDPAAPTWSVGYLMDVINNRDPWMHRLDISRATGREMVVDASHDGRLIADVVREWAGSHGRPFDLTLTGPAGGRYTAGPGGSDAEVIEIDALEFCWILAERGHGTGLLATPVVF